MSAFDVETLCPYCHEINTESREKFLYGDVAKVTCSHCNKEYQHSFHTWSLNRPENRPEEEPVQQNTSAWWLMRSETDPTTSEHLLEVMGKAYVLWCQKHDDYGPHNISYFGARGVLVRMWDKMQRLVRMIWYMRKNKVVNESVFDTLLDISNYALIMYLVLTDKWPKSEGFGVDKNVDA